MRPEGIEIDRITVSQNHFLEQHKSKLIRKQWSRWLNTSISNPRVLRTGLRMLLSSEYVILCSKASLRNADKSYRPVAKSDHTSLVLYWSLASTTSLPSPAQRATQFCQTASPGGLWTTMTTNPSCPPFAATTFSSSL